MYRIMYATYMVAGSGISGISAVRLLLEMHQAVVLYDSNEKLDAEELKKKIQNEAGTYDLSGLQILLGALTEELFLQYHIDICVVSPGIALDTPFLDLIRKRDIPIIGEIELAYCYGRGEVIGITGTNGKTTTTALTGAIMKNFNPETFIVGNIGIPYAQEASRTTEDSIVVAEISSFMLETISSFRPHVSAILNITPDHLNRHKTMECYIEMKERITRYQTPEDTCVLNYRDPVLRSFGKTLKTRVIYFSSQEELEEGIFLRGEDIVWRPSVKTVNTGDRGLLKEFQQETVICNTEEMNLIGVHNYENVMAAIAIAIAMQVPLSVIRDTVRSFQAVEHRIEYVRTVNGVKYYNDSKGTNPDAAIQAIRAMKAPTVLIGGGYDKESQYEEWIAAFDGKVKKLLLMGATKEKIRAAAEGMGFTECQFVESMEEAVAVASQIAQPGENVLLSPACASWGMFENYEQRGKIFKECVQKL